MDKVGCALGCAYLLALILTALNKGFTDHPRITSIILLILLVFGVVLWLQGRTKSQRERERGWRLRRDGRDYFFYEELDSDVWRRIDLPGEMLVGGQYCHVLYMSTVAYPDWAQGRQTEIIERIQQELPPDKYEYQF